MRLVQLQQLQNDGEKQVLVRALCATDIVYFVNQWCWTYDPRETVSTLPFSLFDKQEDFLRWLQAREESDEDGVAEKCRDVGLHGCVALMRFIRGYSATGSGVASVRASWSKSIKSATRLAFLRKCGS